MILGVDIGGTKIAAGLVNSIGKVLHFETRPTEASRGAQHVLANIKAAIAQHLDRSVTAIGVGVAGQVDHEHGILRTSPNLPKDLKGLRLAKIMEREFRLPVVMENDARCFTLAEATYGAGKKYDRVVGVTLGTGVGGGMTDRGTLIRGAQNTAGEFGHMAVSFDGPACSCGKRGHLEAFSSLSGTARRFHEISDARELERLYRSGNRRAARVIQEGARALARGLTNILVVTNPDCIILGGGLANFRVYTNLALREVPKLVPFPHLAKTPIIFSKLGPQAGVIGAALLIKQ